MLPWPVPALFTRRRGLVDIRLRMIQETNAFLTWAFAEERGLPRIPVQPASRGGYDRLRALPPTARQRVDRWWDRTIRQLP
ncbi:MAG: hypothetical protein IT442_09365 [Phycisphaeraceae bacterium]|nr:hypothetical protein [Phycisphaeraceae bacterium]